MSGARSPPVDWPETFWAPSPSCPHQFHWDTDDGFYRCINCDLTRCEPA